MAKSDEAFGQRWLPKPIHFVLDWIGKHELSVLIAMLTIGASIWIFIEVADEVMDGDTRQFDEWAVRSLRQTDDLAVPRGPHWLLEVGHDLTALGGITFLTLLTAVVAGFLWIKGLRAAVALVLVSALGGVGASQLLKSLFDRPRPNVVPHLVEISTSSFPSGHAMLSATVFLTLGTLLGTFVHERVLKAYFLMVAVMLTLFVGLSRIYLGVHYPTDVFTGWVAGLGWATACWLIARFMQRRHIVESEIPEEAN